MFSGKPLAGPLNGSGSKRSPRTPLRSHQSIIKKRVQSSYIVPLSAAAYDHNALVTVSSRGRSPFSCADLALKYVPPRHHPTLPANAEKAATSGDREPSETRTEMQSLHPPPTDRPTRTDSGCIRPRRSPRPGGAPPRSHLPKKSALRNRPDGERARAAHALASKTGREFRLERAPRRSFDITDNIQSAPCRNRTYNLVIKSHLLCQLS